MLITLVYVPRGRSSHWRCSVKKVFLKILQISQENTCVTMSFFIKFTESVTKCSRKKHFPTLKELLLSELPSFSIELGNYQISLILSRLSAVKASCMCTVAFMCHVKSSHYFKKRKELRKYFCHDSNSICLFSVIVHTLSFFRDSTYYLSFCCDSTWCLSFFHDSACYLSFLRDSTCYVFFPS